MQRVIGGEFSIGKSLTETPKAEKRSVIFSSGRGALATILHNEKREGAIILIPDFLCASITQVIKEAGWNYKFYAISADLQFDLNEVLKSENIAAVLLINYFGMFKLNDTIRRLKDKRADLIVIEDDVQGFFEFENSKADYSFTGLRKWFPCPDGALIHTERSLQVIPAKEGLWSQYKFAGNMLKNFAGAVDDSICLELLQKGEELLKTEYMSGCSEVSQVIFSNINLTEAAERRKENAKALHESLTRLGVQHIYNADAVPLFVPIFSENRSELRKRFFENHIFTPIHWPVMSKELNGENKLYATELSLICDQRYRVEDMERQIEIIRRFKQEEEK